MAAVDEAKRVLVLCTGNSCRSILAEALINACGGERFRAVSAGSRPAGHVHPKAIETLERHGIEPGAPRSKSWDEFAHAGFDYVITVCDAAAEDCPAFAGAATRLHWSTPDPAAVRGTEQDVDAAFERAYLHLKACVERELL